ncbi:MAG: TIGR00266 family protein [Candidatus Micrarchaeaceae archaeon]
MEFNILGNNFQFVSVKLNEGESVFCDSGKLISKTDNVVMSPKLIGGIVKAIERKVTGATAMLTEFKCKEGIGRISVGGIYPGRILGIKLEEGQSIVAEDHAFLVADANIKFSVQTLGIGAAFFGGAGFVLQRFEGPGNVFIHFVGDGIEYQLDGTAAVQLEPGHLAAYEPSLAFKVRFVDNIRTMMFGGVGLFLATFEGKGKLYAHSISRFKLSSEIYLDGLKANQKNQ